jgi:uncharacterized coiled-coil protein SlyX
MIKWILAKLGLGGYDKTFDSIVAPINKVITDLESHVDVQAAAITAKNAVIAEAQKAIALAEDETTKAKAAAEKFKALVTPAQAA